MRQYRSSLDPVTELAPPMSRVGASMRLRGDMALSSVTATLGLSGAYTVRGKTIVSVCGD